jgi:hypothetical protein
MHIECPSTTPQARSPLSATTPWVRRAPRRSWGWARTSRSLHPRWAGTHAHTRMCVRKGAKARARRTAHGSRPQNTRAWMSRADARRLEGPGVGLGSMSCSPAGTVHQPPQRIILAYQPCLCHCFTIDYITPLISAQTQTGGNQPTARPPPQRTSTNAQLTLSRCPTDAPPTPNRHSTDALTTGHAYALHH